MTKACKRRPGISPAITSIILIGVAVAAGISGYSVFASTSNTASLKGAITVEGIDLVKQANGEQWLSVTVKNSGNKAFSSSHVNLHVDTDPAAGGIQPFTAALLPASLGPGQTGSISARIVDNAGAAIVAQNIGDAIPMEVVATATDGSTIREMASVVVGIS